MFISRTPHTDVLIGSHYKSDTNVTPTKLKPDSEDVQKSIGNEKHLLYDDLHVFGQRHFLETPSFVFPCSVKHLRHDETLGPFIGKAENGKGKRNWSALPTTVDDFRRNFRYRKNKERKSVAPVGIQCCSVPNLRDSNITNTRRVKSLELQIPKSRNLQETNVVTTRSKTLPFDVQCDVCGLKVRKYEELAIHRSTHVDSKPKRTCSPRTALQVSFYKFHSTPKPPTPHVESSGFKCDWCSATFKRPASLAMHMRLHKKNYMPKWLRLNRATNDPDSEIQFSDLEEVESSPKLADAKEKKYKCTLCGANFDSTLNLRNHVTFAHKVRGVMVCHKCGEIFNRQQELAVHESCHEMLK